jgi:hypothetical protein
MRHTGIDRNHQIKATHQSGGLGKIGQIGGQIDNVGSIAQERLVVRPRILLQTDKARIDVQQARK